MNKTLFLETTNMITTVLYIMFIPYKIVISYDTLKSKMAAKVGPQPLDIV